MTQPPVVEDSAGSFRSGLPAVGVGLVLIIIGTGSQQSALALVGLIAVIVGGFFVFQGFQRSARNRDAVTKALLEQAQRTEKD